MRTNKLLATYMKSHSMRKYLLVALTLSVTACATLKPAKLPVLTETNSQLVTQDLRSKNQSETEMLSYMITNCKYGIQRLGDEWSIPSKVKYLSQTIKAKLPQSKKLEVTHFETYLNMQYMLREGNIYRGPVFEMFECDENTDKFTNYTPEENPKRMNIIIGSVEGTIDGIPFSERVVSFPFCPEGVEECTGWDAQAESIRKIVIELSDKVVSSIGS